MENENGLVVRTKKSLMEFKKNELIDEVLVNYYHTFSLTLDTEDFVSPKYNKKIEKYIFKNMKKKFKTCNKEYKQWLRERKRKVRKKKRAKRKIARRERLQNFKVRLKQILKRNKDCNREID